MGVRQTKDKYILDENGEPQPEYDLLVWADWYENNVDTTCRIKETYLDGNKVMVLTIFCAVLTVEGALWETLVVDKLKRPFNGTTIRDTTRSDALATHDRVVNETQAHLGEMYGHW